MRVSGFYSGLITLILCFGPKAQGQSLPVDSLAENIFSQSYLKYQMNVNCDSAFTTLEMRICANQEFKEKAYGVNYYLKEALSALGEMENVKSKILLYDSQVLWIEQRNAHCKIYWEIYEGGSIQPVVFLNCLSTLSEQREIQLINLLESLK